MRFLDPLKYDEWQRKKFFKNSETDRILETAIKLDQKKVNQKIGFYDPTCRIEH